MRIVFLVLLLANGLIFLWGFGQHGEQAGREPARMAQQLEPEKLRIVPAGTLQPAAPPPPQPAAE